MAWRWIGGGMRIGGRHRYCCDGQYAGPGGKQAIVRCTPEALDALPRGRVRHPADLTRRFGVSKKIEYYRSTTPD